MAEAVPPDAQDVLRCIYCETEVATEYCRKCGDELCTACQKIHVKSKVSSGHAIVPIIQKHTAMPAYKLCLEHSTEKYDAACSDCQEPVCVHCVTEKHSKHKIVKLTDLCGETKECIAEELEIMKGCLIPKTKDLIENNRLHRTHVQQTVANFLPTLQETINMIRNCVDVAQNKIIEELNSCEEELSGNSQTLDKYLTKLNNCVHLYQSREQIFHPAELMLFYKELKQLTETPAVVELDLESPGTIAFDEIEIIDAQLKKLTPKLSWHRTTYDASSVTSNGIVVADGLSKGTRCCGYLIAAIIVGTTHTYHGFSFLHDYRDNPMDIHALNYLTQSPTCVLFRKDLTFEAFGIEAKEIYDRLDEDEHDGWVFVSLWNTPFIEQGNFDTVKAVDGKAVPAILVYSAILEYFTKRIFEAIKDRVTEIRLDDMIFIINVPHIWSPKAKELMINALRKIGMKEKNYHLVTDAEAAYMFCSMLPQELACQNWKPYKPSSKTIFLNHRENELQITTLKIRERKVLNILSQTRIREFTEVDSFKTLLTMAVGKNVCDKYCEQYNDEYEMMFRDFQLKLRRTEYHPKRLTTILSETFLDFVDEH